MKQELKSHKRNRKTAFWTIFPYIIIIIAACTAIVAVIVISNSQQEMPVSERAMSRPVVEITTAQAKMEEQRGTVSVFESGVNEKVGNLIKRYFSAFKNGDGKALDDIVESNRAYDQEKLTEAAGIVEEYENIQCHLVKGVVESTWMVYVNYDIKFKEVSGIAPAISDFYVCENKDGAVYISDEVPDGEQTTYLNEMERSREVQALTTDVKKRLEEACEKNAHLKEAVKRWKEITSGILK